MPCLEKSGQVLNVYLKMDDCIFKFGNFCPELIVLMCQLISGCGKGCVFIGEEAQSMFQATYFRFVGPSDGLKFFVAGA